MSPRWVFIVRFTDREYHSVCERRFLWLQSAEEYAESLRRAGFFKVTVEKRPYRINQRPEARRVLGKDANPDLRRHLIL